MTIQEQINESEFTNKVLRNLNNSMCENGKIDFDKFIELTNKLYKNINTSPSGASEG